MTIKQLKEKIKDLPDYMDVAIQKENTEFSVSLAETGIVITASFSEEPGSEVLGKDDVFLISDEE